VSDSCSAHKITKTTYNFQKTSQIYIIILEIDSMINFQTFFFSKCFFRS